jgi:hypothetical protein
MPNEYSNAKPEEHDYGEEGMGEMQTEGIKDLPLIPGKLAFLKP